VKVAEGASAELHSLKLPAPPMKDAGAPKRCQGKTAAAGGQETPGPERVDQEGVAQVGHEADPPRVKALRGLGESQGPGETVDRSEERL